MEGAISTSQQFEVLFENCRNLFQRKYVDYGTAWRILRTTTLTDQIFIKAKRIRSIQEKGEQKIQDSVTDEFLGIINYSIMAIIQIETKEPTLDWALEKALSFYDAVCVKVTELMRCKNHDYDEAWRDMRVESITDIILMKLLRIRKIEENKGITQYSESITEGYKDIINYAIFSLILLGEISDSSGGN